MELPIVELQRTLAMAAVAVPVGAAGRPCGRRSGGRRAGETVAVETPAGVRRIEILTVGADRV